MDIQLTDHENAAYSVFIVLLAHTISHFDLNFYIPVSKVDENMKKGQMRNAVLDQLFWFRKDISKGTFIVSNPESAKFTGSLEEEYSEQSIQEIMVGDGETTGICTLIDRYLDEQSISECTKQVLKAHVNLVRHARDLCEQRRE